MIIAMNERGKWFNLIPIFFYKTCYCHKEWKKIRKYLKVLIIEELIGEFRRQKRGVKKMTVSDFGRTAESGAGR